MNNKLNIKKASISIFIYFFMSLSTYLIPKLFNINFNNLNNIIKQLYLIFWELLMLIIIFYINKNDLLQNLKDYIKKIFYYLKEYIKYWFLLVILMILSNNIIINFTTTKIANNQSIILEQLKIYPIYIILATIILAPITEEIIFRFATKKLIYKSNILYIIISGLFFGLLHMSEIASPLDWLFMIPYSIPGFIFAYVYTKSENIFVPISLHMIHNTVTLLLIFI